MLDCAEAVDGITHTQVLLRKEDVLDPCRAGSCWVSRKWNAYNLWVRSPDNLRQNLSLITLCVSWGVRGRCKGLRMGKVYIRWVGQPEVWKVQMSRMKCVRCRLSWYCSRRKYQSFSKWEPMLRVEPFSYPVGKVKVKLSQCSAEDHDVMAYGGVRGIV
jgi:hypothetical protein